MDEKIAAITLLTLSILLLGCVQPPVEEDLTGFKDCGENEECILNALESCEKSFATVKTEDSQGIMKAKAIVYGLDGENCRAKYTIENLEIVAEGEEAALAKIVAAMLKGKEMNCLLPEDQTLNITQFDREELEKYCSGSLIDALKSFESVAENMPE